MISINKLISNTFQALKGKWMQAIFVFFVYNFLLALVQAIPGIGGFLSLIISGPLTVGISIYSLNIINDNFPKAENILDGFKYNLGNGILAYFILIPIIAIVGLFFMMIFLIINFWIFLMILSVSYYQAYEAFTSKTDWEALLTPFKLLSFELGFIEPIILILFCVISFCFSFILPWIIASLPFAMTFYIMAEDTSIDAWDAVQKSWNMMKGYKIKYLLLNIVLIIFFIPFILLTLFIGLLWVFPFSMVISAIFYQQIKINASNNSTVD
tara:strand:+ start:3027 stop:3833 length:807 start_codon:yes stop_codon:yes gene_type:complete